MADFYGNLKENLGNLGKTISKRTGEVVEVFTKKTEETIEIQKIKSQIRAMKRDNKNDYQDMGKMIFERYQNGEELDEAYMEICKAIESRKSAIAECKEQVAEIKGLDVCVNCQAHVDKDVVYCPKCGEKVEE